MSNFVQVQLPKAGLGHSLQPYARAFTYHASGSAVFVHPYWFKLRIGPYLRKEMDKRNYHLIIRTPTTWGLAPHNRWRRLFNRVVTEETFDPNSDGQFLVVTDDRQKNLFPRIDPYRLLFFNALNSISRVPMNPHPNKTPSIGIFHRSGDMRSWKPASTDERIRRTHGYGYIPPEYAAEALAKVRRIAGWNVPAVLSTDADASEVSSILSLENITYARTDSALTNMLEMSRHSVLIIGTSSYGKWSWFLGDAFAITPKIENIEHNLLELPNRASAWFIFDNETSLNDRDSELELLKRLTR